MDVIRRYGRKLRSRTVRRLASVGAVAEAVAKDQRQHREARLFERFEPGSLFSKLDTPETDSARPRYILTDCTLTPEERRRVGGTVADLDTMTDEEIANGVFYVCFRFDSDAIPLVRRIKEAGGIFIPHRAYRKTEYRFISRAACRAIEKTLAKRERISHFDVLSHENICEALEITAELPGDFVEIGVYRGGSALTALNMLDELHAARPDLPKRRAWLFDTFTGFDYPEAQTSSDRIWAGTHALFGLEQTIAFIDETLEGTRTEHKLIASNICADELPAEIRAIAVANVDVDIYDATLAALEKVAPRMVPGGIIICEDPPTTPDLYGAMLAMEEFLQSETGRKFVKVFKSNQYFLIRRHDAGSAPGRG